MSRRKTKNIFISLDKKDAIRVEIITYKSSDCKLKNHNVYIYKCLSCSNEIRFQQNRLKHNTGKCSFCSQKGLPFEASYNELLNRSTTVKTLKDLEHKQVKLSYDEYKKLCELPNCHYCDTFLNRSPYTKVDGKEEKNGRSSMLDRKVNSIPYTYENCVPCCWRCNQAKSDNFTYEEWYGMTKYLRDGKTACEVN